MALELYESDNQELYGEDWTEICSYLVHLGMLIENLGFGQKISYTTLKH